MATIGLDKLYYAKITEDTSGNETYGDPHPLAKAMTAELSVELAEATLYADDGAAAVVKEFQSGTLTLGVDDIGVTVAQDLTGATIDGNKVLMQMINADNKPTDWRYRGTPNPITSLGDDRWANYSAEIDFKLADSAADNYIALGVRYLTAELDSWSAENGYSIRVYPNGKWELKKNAQTADSGEIDGFDSSVWHTVRITAAGKHISAELDGTELTAFDDDIAFANSGRVSIGSGLYNNIFDNMKISPVDGYKPTITRVDDHDPSVTYNGDWYRTVPDSYLNFNRTISRAEIAEGDTGEKSFEFSFTGDRFAIIGQTDPADIEVYVDGELLETKKNPWGALARQCSYSAEVPEGEHTVKIKVIGGSYTVDAIEY